MRADSKKEDTMDEPVNQLQALQVLKNFSRQPHYASFQTTFSSLIYHLENWTGPQTSENLQLLDMLQSLGKAAEKDLRRFKIRRDGPDEFGISGAMLRPPSSITVFCILESSVISSSRFKRTFKLAGEIDDPSERESLLRKINFAWVWENGPQPSVLVSTSSPVEDLSIRIYGVESVDYRAAKVVICQDDCGIADKNQKIQLQEASNPSGAGVLLQLSKIYVNNLQGARKSQKNVKMYRVVCDIPVTLSPNFQHQIECMSIPFTVRSGSTQLWPHISSVVWFIWAQQDVRQPDSNCPKELELNSILSLIQARIIGADLRLSSQALWDKMSDVERDKYSTPSRLPHRFTDGERKGWIDTIRENCGISPGDLVSRCNFIKHKPEKLYIWLVVCAAVNTALRLKENDLDRFFHIGISNDMCRSFPSINIGDFILRSSLNRLDSSAGKEPHAKVVVQVCTGNEVDPVVKNVDDFDRWTLQENLSSISIENEGNCVCRILPSMEDVRTTEEQKRDNKGDSSSANNQALSKNRTHSLVCSPAVPNIGKENPACSLPPLNSGEPELKKRILPDAKQPGPSSLQFQPATDAIERPGAASAFQGMSTLTESPLHPDLVETEKLGLDSLNNSPLSSHCGHAGEAPFNELLDYERILSQEDEKYLMNNIPQVWKDVFLSDSSEPDTQYVKICGTLGMSPVSMDSESVCSPSSDNAMVGTEVGFSETGFLLEL
ncbi:hypothetical protein ElyMa_004562000 [Elysia marginata]|uniref:Uncharacterized protein n=1 Tax=Elysia marginata TaxID=1093978 RepID=A0AAV4HR93_9GAST|nr:hypothetical protein ElyMa_004562000 [Elysia marginata]